MGSLNKILEVSTLPNNALLEIKITILRQVEGPAPTEKETWMNEKSRAFEWREAERENFVSRVSN